MMLKLFMKKLTNIYIYIYMACAKTNIYKKGGCLLTNLKQSLLERRECY